MKNDHSFTLTAAVVLAGVVLAFVNPTGANSATPANGAEIAAATTLSSSHDQTVAGALAVKDPSAAKRGKRGHRAKYSCPQIERVDPRA